MAKVAKQREILDRKALVLALSAIDAPLQSAAARAAVLALFKAALADGQAAVRRRLEGGAGGAAVVAANTFVIDQLLEVLFDHAAEVLFPAPNPTAADQLSLVAVGGYGRAELAPASDVDLLFLYPYKLTPRGEQIVEYVLYMLWDLGLKVGHATRSISDCLRRAKADMTIRTSLLESRFLRGDEAPYETFRTRFWTEIIPGTEAEFVAAKLAERDERHRRMGDSRYLLEPNIKDGKGGLRDLHTLFWIAKYLYRVERFKDLVERGVLTAKENARFARAEKFLWKVRAHLHSVTGRAENRLTFDLQPEIARRMGYGARDGNLAVERFMKHYFLVAKTVGELTRVLCAVLEAERLQPPPGHAEGAGLGPEIDGFRIAGGRIGLVRDEVFEERPARLLKLFRLAQIRGLDIHPHALRLVHQNLRLIDQDLREEPEANRHFMAVLTDRRDPETALRRMNEAGVLGRFVREFGRVVAQSQHDMYHVYTVDEHTIRAVGVLCQIENGRLKDELPLASELVHKVLSREALYLAVFLHDLAKGGRGDHWLLGARIAARLCPRFGLSDQETDTVAWLVSRHLLFSETAFKRDVNDPKAVQDFVAVIQSVERLRLLLVLTAADIHAVGPGRWNAWKGGLLRELYHRAEEVITGGHEAEAKTERVAAAKTALRAALKDWRAAEFESYAKRLQPPYWLSLDPDTQLRHAQLVRDADGRKAPLALDIRVDNFRAVTEITVYGPDHAGLFAAVAGAMAVGGASIVDAKVFTTDDGMALDMFWVQDADGGAFDDDEKLARTVGLLEQALAGEIRLDKVLRAKRSLPKRTEVFRVEPRVLIDNRASRRYTIVEINGRDRPGLLYDITRGLTELGLSIVTALISTYGERAVDVFYVKDRFGLKISAESQVERLKVRLLTALTTGPTQERGAPDTAGSPADAAAE